jgi:hypothetical protein
LTEDTGDDLEKIHARERGNKGKAAQDKAAAANGDDAGSSSGS